MQEIYSRFKHRNKNLGHDFEEVSPDDNADLKHETCGIMVGQSGALKVLNSVGKEITLSVSEGTVYPLKVKRILATGTTAGNIIAFY